MSKLLGSILILAGCGGVGFSIVNAHRQQEKALQQLIGVLEHMSCELQYRMTPLPELCRGATETCTGCVKNVLEQVSAELEAQIAPDAAACMHAALSKYPGLPDRLCKCLTMLGDSLGRYDLSGQVQGLASVKSTAEFELEQLRSNQDVRLRSYQTLGLCAGAALVILFL